MEYDQNLVAKLKSWNGLQDARHIWQGDYSELLEQRFRSLKKQCVHFSSLLTRIAYFFATETDQQFLQIEMPLRSKSCRNQNISTGSSRRLDS